jgi:SlyX protein
MDEQRLIALETKITFQEELLAQLNEVVCAQRQQLDRLEKTVRKLMDRLECQDEIKVEKPPHY